MVDDRYAWDPGADLHAIDNFHFVGTGGVGESGEEFEGVRGGEVVML